jgi:hypothetical protein
MACKTCRDLPPRLIAKRSHAIGGAVGWVPLA